MPTDRRSRRTPDVHGFGIRPRLRWRAARDDVRDRGIQRRVRAGGASNGARTVRFDFVPPPGAKVRLTFGPPMAMSPDGRTIAYVGEGPHGAQLWIRDLESGASRALAGTDEPESPAFSPDGRWIVFRMGSRAILAKAPVGGGAIDALYPVPSVGRVTFLTNDSLIFSVSSAGTVWGHLYFGSLAGEPRSRSCSLIRRRCRRRRPDPFWRQMARQSSSPRRAAGRNTGRVIAWATRSGARCDDD